METTQLEIFKKTVIGDQKLTYIFIQPICDLFEINRENQQRFIQNDAILSKCSTKKSDNLLFGDNFKRTCLTKSGFLRWIQLLNPNIVTDEHKDNLVKYQELVYDYLNGESLVPKLKEIHTLKLRNKEIAKEINILMVEQQANTREIKRLEDINNGQLGLELIYNGKGNPQLLEPFSKKSIPGSNSAN
jgi:hypothetical protein